MILAHRSAAAPANRRIEESNPAPAFRTSVQTPWQNGTAERWVGSARREILDHVIALNEPHLRRLMGEYVRYYHDDRIHDSLEKDTPNRRPVEQRPTATATVIPMPGWTAPSVLLATGGVEPLYRHFALRDC